MGAYSVFFGNLKEIYRLEGISVDRRMILKLILQELCVRIWTGLIWVRVTVSGEFFIRNG